MKILIKHGRVLDPDTRKDGIYDVLTEDGVIRKVAPEIEEPADQVLEA